MHTRSLRMEVVTFIATMALLLPYSFSFGDEEVSLTVINSTDRYIHVIMNNTPFLYIAPGRSASLGTEVQSTIFVQAFYSPGQGVSGSATNSFVVGGNALKSDCHSGGTCTTEPLYGSTSWTITPDLLTDNGTPQVKP